MSARRATTKSDGRPTGGPADTAGSPAGKPAAGPAGSSATQSPCPSPPARRRGGRAFYGARSLDLIFIARMAACVILCALLTGLVLVVLTRLGILHESQRLAAPVLIFTIAGSALATIVVLSIMLRRVLKPIRELREAMERVTDGDFSARVTDDGADNELGSLLRSFNTMAGELGSIEMLRDEFVDDFSHELKTPVTSIRGFARQIERNEQATPRDREYAGIIASEADRLIAMSSNVLALNRFESQQVVANARSYALDEQLRRCVLVLQEAWEAREIELDLDGVEPTSVQASEEMLANVWINVLDNAIKYSPVGGRVTVTCENADGTACVTIADNGPGMDEVTLARAFDKFYRGTETAGMARGNGLGLPIVKRIVELSHGSISVRTEPGQGTAFTVTLPTGA